MNRSRARSCHGKRRYFKKAAARAALARTIAHTGELGLQVYPCPHCRGWHVGHAPKKQQRRDRVSALVNLIDYANGKEPR